jgi:hypothetical protein
MTRAELSIGPSRFSTESIGTPDLKVLSSGAAGILLELNFQKIDVLGADFATNLGSFGVRGEASYTRTQDRQGADPLDKKFKSVCRFGC